MELSTNSNSPNDMNSDQDLELPMAYTEVPALTTSLLSALAPLGSLASLQSVRVTGSEMDGETGLEVRVSFDRSLRHPEEGKAARLDAIDAFQNLVAGFCDRHGLTLNQSAS